MNAVAICTSIYETARPFLPAYLDGIAILSQSLGHPVSLVLANDGFQAADQAFSGVAGAVQVVDGRAAGVGGVRRKMIEAARVSDCDALIFCDFDDSLLPGAIGHLAALESADISFGDLQLIDASGNMVASSFFTGALIPDLISSPDALVDRNFLGFSNTAIRREAIRPTAANIPDSQVAADWWFFSMLLEAGARARRCPEAVAKYRQHGANTGRTTWRNPGCCPFALPAVSCPSSCVATTTRAECGGQAS